MTPADEQTAIVAKPVPASVTAAAGYSVVYGYANRGLQTYARFGSASGQGIANAWDSAGRQSSTTSDMGGSALSIAYRYDSNGNRIQLNPTTGYQMGFVYDELVSPSARRRLPGRQRTRPHGVVPGADNIGRRSLAAAGCDALSAAPSGWRRRASHIRR